MEVAKIWLLLQPPPPSFPCASLFFARCYFRVRAMTMPGPPRVSHSQADIVTYVEREDVATQARERD